MAASTSCRMSALVLQQEHRGQHDQGKQRDGDDQGRRHRTEAESGELQHVVRERTEQVGCLPVRPTEKDGGGDQGSVDDPVHRNRDEGRDERGCRRRAEVGSDTDESEHIRNHDRRNRDRGGAIGRTVKANGVDVAPGAHPEVQVNNSHERISQGPVAAKWPRAAPRRNSCWYATACSEIGGVATQLVGRPLHRPRSW